MNVFDDLIDPNRRRRRSRDRGAHATRPPLRTDERGISLAVALAVVTILGVMASAVIMYAQVAYSSTTAYREQRDERYSGDSAINAAVNYVKQNSDEMIDPLLGGTDCRYYAETDAGTVTVDCDAEADSGSGAPAELGLVPPEALVLLGTRHNEPGPYNAGLCSGWWDGFLDFIGIDSATDTGEAETGAFFGRRKGKGLAGASCNESRNRATGSVIIRGDVMAAGKMKAVENMSIEKDQVYGDSILWAREGCEGSALDCRNKNDVPPNRTALPGQAHLAGTAPDTDPGRNNPNAVDAQPIRADGSLDVASAWMPVGFNANGTPKSLGYAMPGTTNTSMMPPRNTAYIWDGESTYTPTHDCPNTTATIVFLPGWYSNSEDLSRYTTSPNCKDVNFWFAPNPGPDGILLTDDDETGGFYFDFVSGSDRRCGPKDHTGQAAPAHPSRWCIGGDDAQNARIVAGTPQNWTPVGDLTVGGGGSPSSIKTVIDTAHTVDLDLSQTWQSDPPPIEGAEKLGDGKVAHYRADICIIWCFSQDRAIRVRDLTPSGATKVTSPALAEPGAPKGRLWVTVGYAVENPQAVEPAEAVIEAVSDDSGRHKCGTYTLYGNPAAPTTYDDKTQAAGDATNIKEYRFTESQATEVANRCGELDKLNGLEVKVQVRGNSFNSPRTDWWFDGVKIEYDTIPSATFPEPIDDSGPAAKSDCDPNAPGAQFIFGGDSHVYVADGSLEICAGPHPDSPADKLQIGLWALPAVPELKVAAVAEDGSAMTGDTRTLCAHPSGTRLNALLDIDGFAGGTWRNCGGTGTPGQSNYKRYNQDENVVVIEYGGCTFCEDREAGLKFSMEGYTAPPGYKIAKVEARLSLNAKSENCTKLWDCPGAKPQFEPLAGGSCGRINLQPSEASNGPLQNHTGGNGSLVLFDAQDGRNCLGVPANQKAVPATNAIYWARATCVLATCFGPFKDDLDGVRYQITLEPESAGTARLRPQAGCIVHHPNYDAGYGNPDCAIVRADTGDMNDNFSWPWANKEGQWRGRFSVKGTVWTPDSAIEVDDTDVAYPLATRGAVLRHLRVSGWGTRDTYNEPAISNVLDETPAPREGTLVACIQSESRRSAGEPCDENHDRVLSQARAFLTPTLDEGNPGNWNWDADIEWWTNRR